LEITGKRNQSQTNFKLQHVMMQASVRWLEQNINQLYCNNNDALSGNFIQNYSDQFKRIDLNFQQLYIK
jgi:hypothetical protein